jgi:hypothetical protein
LEEIIDHPGLGAVPSAPEQIDSGPSTEIVDNTAILLDFLHVVRCQIVSRIVEKIDLLVWIGKIAKTDEIGFNDLDGFVV